MAKVDIEKLENLVLEGGGAKGATYVGAIQGVEDALAKHYAKDNGGSQPNAKAILDYGKFNDGKLIPQVKRFAGSSAGAITSFALALGLNSDQVNEVSQFEFKNFLQELDQGKYRMIDERGKIYVGEDKWKFLGRGDGSEEYEFRLDTKHKVHKSLIKSLVRGQILNTIMKILIAGLLQFFANVKGLFEKIGKLFSKGRGGLSGLEPDEWGKWSFAFKLLINILTVTGMIPKTPKISNRPAQILPSGTQSTHSAQFDYIATKVAEELVTLAFWKLSKSHDMKLGMDTIANVIWDRGMFSGFAVREFFFDLMIYACLNDTHFHRRRFTNEDDRKELRQIEMSMKDGRLKADFSSLNTTLRDALMELPLLTFEEFYDITGVSLTICVTNYAADQPLYFSERTTPSFPVSEAVGASMALPLALKPLYNASDVFPEFGWRTNPYCLDPKTLETCRRLDSGYFDVLAYERDALAIKMILAKVSNVAIDPNTSMSFSGYLLPLSKFPNKFRGQVGHTETVEVDGKPVTIPYRKFVFHYNAAFKGLLLDGGYRCNIPYNVYRNFIFSENLTDGVSDPMWDKTLAIKLDNTWPKEIVISVYNILKEPLSKMGSPKFLSREQRSILGMVVRGHFRMLVVNVNKKSKDQLFKHKDIKSLNDECFERLAAEVATLYTDMSKRYRTPWNRQKSILAIVAEGYAFGAEQGQIRYLSDHEHIIPLYSYGIGTYDFDLKEIMGLVTLSQQRAREQVKVYFEAGPGSAPKGD